MLYLLQLGELKKLLKEFAKKIIKKLNNKQIQEAEHRISELIRIKINIIYIYYKT